MSLSNTGTPTADNPTLLPQRRIEHHPRGTRQVPRRLTIVILALGTMIFHFAVIEGVYLAGRQDPQAKQKTEDPISQEQKVSFKISLPEPSQPAPDSETPRPEPKPSKPHKSVKVERPAPPPTGKKAEPRPARAEPQKAAIKKATSEELQTLGQQHMPLVQEGAFPSLTLSYPDPETYIRQMYQLGARTLIHHEGSGMLYEIHLLNGRILPVAGKDLSGFSVIKRVIHDEHWNPLKDRAASRLKTRAQELSIILALPQEVETRWVGHQVFVFQNAGVALEKVLSVDALFQNARLKVVALHLKDGSVRKISDPGCG